MLKTDLDNAREKLEQTIEYQNWSTAKKGRKEAREKLEQTIEYQNWVLLTRAWLAENEK